MTGQTSPNSYISIWLDHIRSLAVDIGPRGSTRSGERQGALYAQAQFEKMGLKHTLETFYSAQSIFHPHLLGSGLMLLAFILFPVGGRITAIAAALISIFAVVSELLELGFYNNPFRMIVPKAQSQNVFAVIPPASEHRRDLVLVGHLDSQRTPIIFSTRRWVKVYGSFTIIAFVCFVLQIILYSLAVFVQLQYAWYVSIPSAICAVILAAMCLQAEATPFTAGANDNASGVGMVLALAEEYSTRPLQHTRVFAVCTGCEEVQHYGMNDFYRRHLPELKNPVALIFEMLGCSSPGWVTREGIIVPFKADKHLEQLADRLAAEHLEWEAHPVVISGGNTEMSDAVRCKIPAITIMGITREGVSPFWHQPADTFDKMNPALMEKSWEMIHAMIKCLDIEQ